MEIAADLAGRIERGGHLHALEPLRRFGWQKGDLDALRKTHFLFQPRLVRPQFLVQPRILDRHRRLARQERQDLDVTLGERIELRALEIDDADAAILDEHRDRKLRAHVGDNADVPRILRDIRHEHRFAMERSVSDNALAEADAGRSASPPKCTAI